MSKTTETTIPKKRGAPLGNINGKVKNPRCKQVCTRFTESEFKAIQKEANKQHLAPTELIRQIVTKR